MAREQTQAPNPASQQQRPPRILWAMPFCLLDTSSGANVSIRTILRQLVRRGYEVFILGATIFDSPTGITLLKPLLGQMKSHKGKVVSVVDGELTHHLFVTQNAFREKMTPPEEGIWHVAFLELMDSLKPDLVGFYGGRPLELLIPYEARLRGIPSLFYLVNQNYQASRWCQDIDLIITDTLETASFYQKKIGFVPVPVGKFIESERFIAEDHQRERLLFINPSQPKGVTVVVQLALALEQQRPDILIEVVESRGSWPQAVKKVTAAQGQARVELSNVIVTPNTTDMRPIYSRARVLFAPSLWWESGARVLAEAMLNGIPAVVSNQGGSPSMVGDGGILVDFPPECYKEPYDHLLSDTEVQGLIERILPLFDDEALYQAQVERAYEVGCKKHHIDVSTERLCRTIAPFLQRRAGDRPFKPKIRKYHRHNLSWGSDRASSEVPANFDKAQFDLADVAQYQQQAEAARAQSEQMRLPAQPASTTGPGKAQPGTPAQPPTGAAAQPRAGAAAGQPGQPQGQPAAGSAPSPEGGPSSAAAAEPWAAEAATAASASDEAFSWEFTGQIIALDNRAKLIQSGDLDRLLDTGAIAVLAFDPASEVQGPEQYELQAGIQLFRHALLGDGQPATLYTCLDPNLSSTLKPLPAERLPEHLRSGAKVLTQIPISTIALDKIDGLESLDWLLLDPLSDAIAILEHGQQRLKHTLLLQARIAFQPTHERQPSLAELQHWASRNGFRFYRFIDASYHSLFPADSEARQRLASELQSLDALFIPSDERLKTLDDNRKQKLVFLLHTVFNAHDLAYQVMSQVNALLAKQYLRFVEGQVGEPVPVPPVASAEAGAPAGGPAAGPAGGQAGGQAGGNGAGAAGGAAEAATPALANTTAAPAATAETTAARSASPAPATQATSPTGTTSQAPAEAASNHLSAQEQQILATFKARATPPEPLGPGEKGLFIDCGGYDGCSSIKFRIHNPGFDCVTFEPNPTLWGYYEGLPTQLIKKAAFTYNGEIKFTQDNIDEDGSSVVRRKKIDFTGQKKNSQFPTIKVDCIDLAEFIAQSAQTYDKLILKLDVEGAEYDILDTLIEQDLLRHVSKLHCEFHWQKCGIPQHRHDAIVAKVEETTKILDWDALDFSVHKRGEAQAQMRRLILRELVAAPQAIGAPEQDPQGANSVSDASGGDAGKANPSPTQPTSHTQTASTATHQTTTATLQNSQAGHPPKRVVRDKRLLTKQEALASLSGPTLADFGVELKPLKITSTREVIKRRDELYETTRKTLTQLLNDYHGVRHSERYWDILLHYFLAYRFCSNYLSRWNNGLLNDQLDWEAITAQFPTRETFEFGPKTAALVGAASPFIAESLTGSGRVDGMSRERSKIVVANNREAYNKLAQYFESATKGKDAIGINIGSHSPDYWRNEWNKDGVDLIDLPPFSSDTHKSINWKFRAEIAQLDEDNPFHDCEGLWSSLALCLPCEFVEDYPRLVDLTRRLLVGKQPAVVISTLMGMTSWRFVAAQLAEQEIPLHLQQHGGGYGDYPSHIASRIETRISDVFWTWGWQDNAGKTKPAPMHRFESMQQIYEKLPKTGQEILVIGSHQPLVPTEFDGTDLDFFTLRPTLNLINAIDDQSSQRVVYRFRRQHGYSPERERSVIETLSAEVQYDIQLRSIAEAYASASEAILVSSHGTSSWECDHLGIPYRVVNQLSPELMAIPSFIPDRYESD